MVNLAPSILGWEKSVSFLNRFLVCLLVSFFILSVCLVSNAYASTTEITAIIKPVRYIYLNRDNNIRSIVSNTSSNKNLDIYWLDYRNKSVDPSAKELIQYNYLISTINLQKTGSIYSLESPKKLKTHNIFSVLISKIPTIRLSSIF